MKKALRKTLYSLLADFQNKTVNNIYTVHSPTDAHFLES